MMNNGQPAVPMYPGRRQHEMPYTAPQPPYPTPYHGYHHQHIPQHYHPQPPPQWAYYNMQAPMQRPYPPYPPMMNAPYPMPQPQHPPAMSPRPHPPHHTPSPASIRSHQGVYSPPALERAPPPAPAQAPVAATEPSPPAAASQPTSRMPFYPELPWYSVPKDQFPSQSSRRRRTFAPQSPSLPVELPAREDDTSANEASKPVEQSKEGSENKQEQVEQSATQVTDPGSSDTTSASMAASEMSSSSPTTPPSAVVGRVSSSTPTGRQQGKLHPVIPVVPNIPNLSRANKKIAGSATSEHNKSESVVPSDADNAARTVQVPTQPSTNENHGNTEEASQSLPVPVKAPPKSWADLVRSKVPKGDTTTSSVSGSSVAQSNGHLAIKSESLADVLLAYKVRNRESDTKIAFLKPRGLVNTGNMCYMNSVLQILVFCVPFYDLLDQIGKNAAHSFKSDTPMVDAMIMFLREFPVIDSAISAEQLNMRLKDKELEEYGEPFSPEYVYDVIRRIPRFSSMRRGHQQDAEEFLGFLLEEMHEECVRAMKGMGPKSNEESKSPAAESVKSDENGWLEVGPKQRAAITRSSGIVETESPITKIFGGNLRSEFRVPGHKNSVTLEPYQPLQLDIGSPNVNNIIDALKGLTRSETLHGDFNSPRGPGVSATKQVFVETLPPVLILHLKRFQYDNSGGTQKIWKKVGYPLDLEIPKEVFPPHKRGGLVAHSGLPKYRLIGVVYHHGKNASGGHYTVDVRRQNEREWIRIDDTVIRRIKSEDVAEGGSEEDPKVLAAALEQHKRDQSASSNIFDQVREENEELEQAEKGWSQVNGSTHSPSSSSAPKKWSGVVNGAITPTPSSGKRTPVGRFSVKDNKVAYILFYQKIGY